MGGDELKIPPLPLIFFKWHLEPDGIFHQTEEETALPCENGASQEIFLNSTAM